MFFAGILFTPLSPELERQVKKPIAFLESKLRKIVSPLKDIFSPRPPQYFVVTPPKEIIEYISPIEKTKEGVVTLLMPESPEDVKKKIQESFSDEVEVTPDEDLTGGKVIPRFPKDAPFQEYLFTLVPVDQQDSK